tara:strand:- start:2923 stop:5112 length:2190 start_codon:yes stop_codon:yes gene_type:complete
MLGSKFRSTFLFGLVLTGSAAAQQFTSSTSILPANNTWTEGVECVDVDMDGDLDLIFANGDGFVSAGTQRQNLLLINQFIPSGILTFTDESVARLGVNLSNGKGVTTGDVNGDGWVDLLYLNGFNTDPPHLYINQGAANPGFFTMESAARGFTQNLSSASAQFGDLDDDGDLDCIVMHSGSSFLGGSGSVPKLYMNDGTGVFVDSPMSFPAPTKAAHMDAQLVDLDGDWDLDFLGFCRSGNSGGTHYMMLNDGSAGFTNVSTTLPNTSSSVYEAEPADLDGDDDIDIFYTSLNGFNEGYTRNNFTGSGILSFTNGPSLPPGTDDNEIGLIDYDNDGDYDVLVGSLGSRERLYKNNGNLSFVEDNPAIQDVGDSTLDLTIGDLDNDGDYDFVTGQGESGSFTNRVYINSGSADTLAPVIVRDNVPATISNWPMVVRAEVRDQVRDDGVDYVSAKALVIEPTNNSVVVTYTGGDWSPSSVNLNSGDSIIFQMLDPGFIVVEGTGGPGFTQGLVTGQSFEVPYVAAGVTGFIEANSGDTGTVTTTGSPTEYAGLKIGGGQHRFEIPDQDKPFLIELCFTDYPGNTSGGGAKYVGFAPVAGVNYCTTVANSTGLTGEISASGTSDVSLNFLTLNATNLPPGEFGFLLTSMTQDQIAIPATSPGFLCLGGTIGRFITQIVSSGSGGFFCVRADLTAMPVTPNVAVMVGESWNFQFWHRDGASSNFTDGIEITFN